METLPITQEDEELIEAARAAIAQRFVPGRHHIGAAVRTKSGKVFTAVHLEANVGRVAVCAEAIAIGKAMSEGETELDTVVAVAHPKAGEENQQIRVVAPCGICRELISDYGPDAKVIFSDGGAVRKAAISALLPPHVTPR